MTKTVEFIGDKISENEYRAFLNKTDFSQYTKSDEEEVKKIKNLLELRKKLLVKKIIM